MTRARDVANVLSTATSLATDTETAAAISNHNTSANGHVKRGGTASRPESPTIGDIYYNTELRDLEQYTEDGWMLVAKQPPRIPTIGSASLDGSNNASVSFTPSTYGQPATSYTVQSNPGSFTATGSSSPISISGSNLEPDTSYTFRVKSLGEYGESAYSIYTLPVTTITLGNFESIQTVTVGAGGQGSIEFNSIPNTYTHLQIRGITANSVSGDASSGVLISLNSDTTAGNYKSHALYGDGSSAIASSSTRIVGNSGSTNGYNAYVIDILDYKNTNKYKTVRSLSGFDQSGYGFIWFGSALWMNTNAVTSITLAPGANNWTQYTQLALYGVKS